MAVPKRKMSRSNTRARRSQWKAAVPDLVPIRVDGEVKLVIKNYDKPNDSVTLVFNKQQKAIQSVQVSTYLDDPKDAVTIAAQFSKLPDGTNHVASTQIDGVSKQLTVVTQNSTYQPV